MTPQRPGRDAQLALRQQVLVLRNAELRAALAAELSPWRERLAWSARLQQALACLRTHPAWPAGAVVAAVVLRPRRAIRWALRAWGGWRVWRRVLPLFAAVAPPVRDAASGARGQAAKP